MKRKKIVKFCMILFAVSITMMLSGCRKSSLKDQQKENEVKKVQIGMSFDSFVIERWQKDKDVFVSAAKNMGAEVNVQNANGDVQTQISQIEYLIEKKVDVLVIVCIDSNSLTEVIKKAKNAGIKIISYDRLIKNSDVDLYISFDNERVGELMGDAMIQSGLEKKKVLMLTGPTADNNVLLVEEGFRHVMEDNGVDIVDTMYADGWKAELAADYIYNDPEILDEIDGIMCGNDNIATTVIRVLAEKRLAGKLRVVGQDADLEACQRIVEGTQVMTVYKPVEKLAQAAAEYAYKMAAGKEVGEIEKTIYDGSFYVPYVVLEPISVTKENMDDTIIKSGFHLKEEIYMNIPQNSK